MTPGMRLFLIRHAQTGERLAGTRDLYRPLSAKGHDRARQLVSLLGGAGIEKVIASPATRCLQTVEPLAIACGLVVEEQPDLWEGSPIPHVIALLEQQRVAAAAVGTHGDIIPEVVEWVGRQGASVVGRGCEKGSVWILDHAEGAWTSARYLDRSQAELPLP